MKSKTKACVPARLRVERYCDRFIVWHGGDRIANLVPWTTTLGHPCFWVHGLGIHDEFFPSGREALRWIRDFWRGTFLGAGI